MTPFRFPILPYLPELFPWAGALTNTGAADLIGNLIADLATSVNNTFYGLFNHFYGGFYRNAVYAEQCCDVVTDATGIGHHQGYGNQPHWGRRAGQYLLDHSLPDSYVLPPDSFNHGRGRIRF